MTNLRLAISLGKKALSAAGPYNLLVFVILPGLSDQGFVKKIKKEEKKGQSLCVTSSLSQ